MAGYFVSPLMGLAVGVAYALVQIRSPAPPLIALVGLLGILLGEQAVGLAKHHLARPVFLAIADRRTNISNDTRKAVAELLPRRSERTQQR
jgi:XapX domain-containing protein